MTTIQDQLGFFIDLDRYPIHAPESAACQNLIAECHVMMEKDTLCLLDGFLTRAAVAQLCDEITCIESNAHQVNYCATPYGWMNNSGFPPEHPRSQLPLRKCGVITTDLLAHDGYCMKLFQFDALTEFVRRLLQYETLYRAACPTLAVQINTMDQGESFGWHYDTNDGVVSFTIQNADNGGGFEYMPLIRSEDDENYETVSKVLDGTQTAIQPTMSPGTFSLFLGRRSLHRVAPVGPTNNKRQSLLFSYDRKPGMVFPPKTCERLTSNSSAPYLGQGTVNS